MKLENHTLVLDAGGRVTALSLATVIRANIHNLMELTVNWGGEPAAGLEPLGIRLLRDGTPRWPCRKADHAA